MYMKLGLDAFYFIYDMFFVPIFLKTKINNERITMNIKILFSHDGCQADN